MGSDYDASLSEIRGWLSGDPPRESLSLRDTKKGDLRAALFHISVPPVCTSP
jgi:hypothetical protein